MSEVTVTDFAKTLNVPVERLIVQLDEAGIKVAGAEDVLSEDAKLELLTHLRRAHGKQEAAAASPRSITLKRKSHGELKLAGGQGRARTVNVEVRSKRTYTRRDVLEEQARLQQAELDAARQAEQYEKDSGARAEQERLDAIEAEQRRRTEEVEAADREREAAEKKRQESAEEETRRKADDARRAVEDAAREARERERETKVQKEIAQRQSKRKGAAPDHTLHVADGAAGRRRKKKSRRRTVNVNMDSEHGFEKPTAPVVREIEIAATITVTELSQRLALKSNEVIKTLMGMGMMVTINQALDQDTAILVVEELGHVAKALKETAVEDELLAASQEDGVYGEEATRPAVVTVVGHVDHGKTSLLDFIRRTKVAAGEAGGITQHIGAYHVDTPRGTVTFLDTPGHAAFTAMRARGAQVTDIVVLVVAADDGVMPQTKEAVNHAKAASVPIVVAVNKIDKPDANAERVKRQLSELGLQSEEWGGDTLFAEVSAQTGQGIEALLEKIILQAEVLELRATPTRPGTGLVVEAELDRGRGPVATILVMDGTLTRGDVILAGAAHGKVRAMYDSQGRQLETAGPATPVSIIGLNDVPGAGDQVHAVKDIKKAQEIAETRKTKERRSLVPSTGQKALNLEDLHKAMQEDEQLELKLIIKADVQGSVEAVSEALTRLTSEKVKVSVVHAAAGAITEGDVNLAVAAAAIIIGFNVRPAGKAAALAQKEGVPIRPYSIIYNVVDEVKAAMEGLLAPTMVEKLLGKAEVRQVFRISKAGVVAGCMVVSGSIRRSGSARLMREGAEIWKGKLASLKRFKDDVREVKEGFDCGIALEGFNDIKELDVVEAYEIESVKQTL
jgi:translation initiation factor IF-2